MVAEMEAEALEQAHKLDQMLKVRDQDQAGKEQAEISSLIGSQDSEEENVRIFRSFLCLKAKQPPLVLSNCFRKSFKKLHESYDKPYDEHFVSRIFPKYNRSGSHLTTYTHHVTL